MLSFIRTATVATVSLLAVGNLATAQTLLFDFGRHDGVQGNPTTSPDVNGNYWNNFSANGEFEVPIGYTVEDLVDTDGTTTTVDLVTNTLFRSNGRNNGGLLNPDANLLGEFAIGTATEDYWFAETGGSPAIPTTSFTLSGLEPGGLYDFELFGTRDTGGGAGGGTRVTRYTLTGGNVQTATLQTSGSGAGTNGSLGNNDDTIVFSSVMASPTGTVVVGVAVESGNFGYLGVMSMTAVPEPASLGLLGLAGLALVRRRN